MTINKHNHQDQAWGKTQKSLDKHLGQWVGEGGHRGGVEGAHMFHTQDRMYLLSSWVKDVEAGSESILKDTCLKIEIWLDIWS